MVSSYTCQQEEVLREFADKAQCYRWLHDHSFQFYSHLYLCFQIPVIFFTTVSGMMAVFSRAYIEESETIMIFVALTNILCALCNTLSAFLKLAELSEAHRMATLAWGKFARNIRIVLSLESTRRPAAQAYIERCKDEIDRLSEFSPSIPPRIQLLFRKEVDHKDENLILPEMVGDLRATVVTRPAVYDCETQTVPQPIHPPSSKSKATV
jgi:hypothetical protein